MRRRIKRKGKEKGNVYLSQIADTYESGHSGEKRGSRGGKLPLCLPPFAIVRKEENEKEMKETYLSSDLANHHQRMWGRQRRSTFSASLHNDTERRMKRKKQRKEKEREKQQEGYTFLTTQQSGHIGGRRGRQRRGTPFCLLAYR